MDDIWSGIGSAVSGLFGYQGQKKTNIASAQQAQKQMDFQREMSNTAVQRRMADLRKAGINPILAGSKEASSPAGQQAPVGNKAQAAIQASLNSAQASSANSAAIKAKAEAIPYQFILDSAKNLTDPKKQQAFLDKLESYYLGPDPVTDSSTAAEIKANADHPANNESLPRKLMPTNFLRKQVGKAIRYFSK